MNEGRISTRYARALLATHTASGSAGEAYAQAQSLLGVLRAGGSDVSRVLQSSVLSPGQQLRFVRHLVERVAPLLQPFIELMFARRRLGYIERTLLVFLELYRRQEGVVWAEVSAAHPLDAGQQQRIVALLGQFFSGAVELAVRVDPELIGGFRLVVNGYQYDRSVRGELDRLRRELS